MTVFLKQDYPIRWIPVGKLDVVWIQAQRNKLDVVKRDEIAENFNPDAFGVLHATEPNGNGIHHLIDGYTRRSAVQKLWGDNERVPCVVLPMKSAEEAAELFLLINEGRTRPQTVTLFKVAVVAGRPDECEVNSLIESMGYRIGFSEAGGVIRAVTACMAVQKRYGIGVLEDALKLIQATWGTADGCAVNGAIIRGFAALVGRHGDSFNRIRLAKKVSTKFTPSRFMGAARSSREFDGGTISSNIYRILARTYNHGLRTEERIDA